MAANGDLDTQTGAHQKEYHRFLGLMNWGTILSLITGFIVILVIRN